MRRVVLHAGQPKTGTTAIQQFCAANRPFLRSQGYLFPSAGRERRGNHKFLLLDILGRPQNAADRGAALRFRDEVEESDLRNVIVSSEWLFAHLVINGTASRVLHFFEGCGLRPEILIYLRPDAERINSGYVQQTRSFFVSDDFPTFARSHAEWGSGAYGRLLRLKGELGPRLTLLPYDREVAENGAVRSFLRAIGLPEASLAELGPERRANESAGPIAVAAARETLARMRQRGREPTRAERHALAKALNQLIAEEPREPAFQGLDDPLAGDIEAQLAEERNRLALAVWGKAWAEVFPAKERKPRNVFDPTTAGPAELDRYQRFIRVLSALVER